MSRDLQGPSEEAGTGLLEEGTLRQGLRCQQSFTQKRWGTSRWGDRQAMARRKGIRKS